MKRGRLPLTALRSFEAAGRLMSFTAAADELFVSQAAISRQIRDLEISLGHPLFTRIHRSVELTPEGAALLATLTSAFDSIDAALERLATQPEIRTVKISCEPSFAALWLVPRLDAFLADHPQLDISIDADPRPIEFRVHEAEIAIRYSETQSQWPRVQSRLLTPTEMLAVASPDLLDGGSIPSPRDLASQRLLHIENRDMWARWFELHGCADMAPARGPVLDDAALVLQSVLRGHGVGLVDSIFVTDDINRGRLVALTDRPLPAGAYWIVVRDFARLSPAASEFVSWLTSCFDEVALEPQVL